MANTKISALSSATTPLSGSEIVPLNQSGVTESVSVSNLTAGRTVSANSFLAPSIGADTGSSLSLQSNGATKATLDTSGNFGVGVVPSSWGSNFRALQIADGVALTGRTGISRSDLMSLFTNTYFNGTNYVYLTSRAAAFYAQDSGTHSWNVAPSGTAGNTISFTTSWTIDNTSNFVQGVAGKGINFTANTPASGMTSQNLTWYEEGTWTPVVGGTATYTSQAGRYTRIGRTVYISGHLKINTLGTGIAYQMQGLPFTSANDTLLHTININSWSGLATTPVYAVGYVPANGAVINLNAITSGSASLGLLSILTNGSELYFSGTYQV